MDLAVNAPEHHEAFHQSACPHVLMITNHGIHQWEVIPGLPDTGGQNVFVNQFTDAMVKHGWRVTTVNRGGYAHPHTGVVHQGLDYKSAEQRIVYIEDGEPEFVRKEDMHERIELLVDFLAAFLIADAVRVDLIVSHYWDSAHIGHDLKHLLSLSVPHHWIPHSLGAVKKRNMAPVEWHGLRIDERIAAEARLIPSLDGVAHTSHSVRESLQNDYAHTESIFLPPCVDPQRHYPRRVQADDPVWEFLSKHCGLTPEQARKCQIVTEISRTDVTKRKNIVIEAFARVRANRPYTLLVLAVDEQRESIAGELHALIDRLGVRSCVAVVGSVWDMLPSIYAVTDVYCTPSVMEGFGMSIQEAAATRVAAVSSTLVPFAVEHLLGENPVEIELAPGSPHTVTQGEAAIVVMPDDVEGFAFALDRLLGDDGLRTTMARRAYEITVPYFTWDGMVQSFLEHIDARPPAPAQTQNPQTS